MSTTTQPTEVINQPTEPTTAKRKNVAAITALSSIPLQKDSEWMKQALITPFATTEYPLSIVIEAFTRSEKQFQQFPVNEKKVADLEKSIFFSGGKLLEPITLAVITGSDTLYGVGGRHRSTAILQGLTQLKAAPQFAALPEQQIPVIVLFLNSTAELLDAIQFDNSSRNMSTAEKSSLKAQHLGVNFNDDQSFLVAANNAVGKDLSNVFATAIWKQLRGKVVTTIKDEAGSRQVPVSAQTLLTLGKSYYNYIAQRIVPRPASPKSNELVMEESQDELNERWDEVYPIPEKTGALLTQAEIMAYVPAVCEHMVSFLAASVFESSLVARELVKTSFTYQLISDFHNQRGTVLDELRAQKEAAKEASKTRSKRDPVAMVADLMSDSSLDQATLQAVQAALEAKYKQQS